MIPYLRRIFMAGAAIAMLYVYITEPFKPDPTLKVEGHFAPEFADLAELFEKHIRNGDEKGAAFAIYHKGSALVDIWAGYADESCGRRWNKATMTSVFSVTKGVTAIVIALMVDRELLKYDDLVSKHWPKFSRGGKDNITVEMLLSHTAGLAALDESVSLLDLVSSPEVVEDQLERQSPLWPAGSTHGSHVVTYGLYLDRLVQKVDPKHRAIAQFFQEEIANPLEISDLYMNLPRTEFYRVARLETLNGREFFVDALFELRYWKLFYNLMFSDSSLASRAFTSVKEFGERLSVFNNPFLREVTLTSMSGTGNAGSLAKLFSIVVNGEYQEKPFLSEEAVKKLTLALTSDYDFVLRMKTLPKGLGTMIRKNPSGNVTFGHSGFGGQAALADVNYNVGMAYVTNYLSIFNMYDDPRFVDLETTAYACLDEYFKSNPIS